MKFIGYIPIEELREVVDSLHLNTGVIEFSVLHDKKHDKVLFEIEGTDSVLDHFLSELGLKHYLDKLKSNEGKYIIVDLRDMDYMKNEGGEINYYETFHEASITCGMYEFENAWICKLVSNHIE